MTRTRRTRHDIHTYSMAYARNRDRKRTADGAKTAQESQAEPYAPIKRALQRASFGALCNTAPIGVGVQFVVQSPVGTALGSRADCDWGLGAAKGWGTVNAAPRFHWWP